MERIGKYDIVGELGQGGMGMVYKGRDSVIGRDVAIKVIQERALNVPEIKKRFYREARSAGRLSHENITIIYDVGEEGGVPYLVMEYLEGEDLREAMDRGRLLTNEEKLHIAIQVCHGLHFAHSHEIVHRDIKPANIRLLKNGRIKIMDFGIARIQSEAQALTLTNTSLGTPRYMAPEQVKGQDIDHRADIFSFGVMFYEMLMGDNPFVGDHVTTIIYKILNAEPPPINVEPGQLSAELQPIVAKCLAKDREERYQNFMEVARDLQPILSRQDETVILTSPLPLDVTMPQAIPAPHPTLEATQLSPAPTRASVPPAATMVAPQPQAPSRKGLYMALGVILLLVSAGGILFFGPFDISLRGGSASDGSNLAVLDSSSEPQRETQTPTEDTTLPSPDATNEEEAPTHETDTQDNSTDEAASTDNQPATSASVENTPVQDNTPPPTPPAQTDSNQPATQTPTATDESEGEATIPAEPEEEEEEGQRIALPHETEANRPSISGFDVSSTRDVTQEASGEQGDADAARAAMEKAKASVPSANRSSTIYQQATGAEREGNTAYSGKKFDHAVTRFNEAEGLFEEAAKDQLPAIRQTMNFLTRDLRSFLQEENVVGLKAMFYKDWSQFFQMADSIRATITPGDINIADNMATVDVAVYLNYLNTGNRNRQETNTFTHTWTLTKSNNEWILTGVSAR